MKSHLEIQLPIDTHRDAGLLKVTRGNLGASVVIMSVKPLDCRTTNKVRLCERSEPQSEPFVGRARPVQRWSKNTEK